MKVSWTGEVVDIGLSERSTEQFEVMVESERGGGCWEEQKMFASCNYVPFLALTATEQPPDRSDCFLPVVGILRVAVIAVRGHR